MPIFKGRIGTPALSRRASLWSLVLLAVIAGAVIWRLRQTTPAAGTHEVLVVGDQKGGAQALFPAASPLLEALDAGAVDIGGIGGAPFAFAYASGAKIKVIAAYRPPPEAVGKASAIIVAKGSQIRTLADLKGKKLATIKGSAGQDLALKLLEKAGLKANDVQWVYLANGEAKAALATGAIDAWSTWGSYVGIAVIEDGDRILADGSGVASGEIFFAAGDAAIDGKKAQLADFVARLTRARAWGRKHQDDYARTLSAETGIPFKVARFSTAAALGPTVPINAALVAEQRAIFQRYKAAGVISEIPNIEGGYLATYDLVALPKPSDKD